MSEDATGSDSPTAETPTIQTVAELFRAFLNAERTKLDQYELKHGPTIGDMYEGLSKEIINRALPEGLGLRVVDGFVIDHQGKPSGQMDCMLVRGTGEQVPYTSSYKWPIWDVLAVFEVKKTLAKEDLRDSFVHLRAVYDSFDSWINSDHARRAASSIASASKAFKMTTGMHLDRGNFQALPKELKMIYRALVFELLSPVRIVWAYGGYKTEAGLRDALWDFLVDKQQVGGTPGFGVPCFPQLISCNRISLIKSNGQPYTSGFRNGQWEFLHSSRTNPAWLMLELIWAKISNTFDLAIPFPDGLETEAFTRFIKAEPVVADDKAGWIYNRIYFKDVDLDKEIVTTVPWKPFELTLNEYVLINVMNEDGFVDTTDRELLAHFEGTAEESVERLVQMGIVVRDGTKLRPLHETLHTVVTPKGQFLASPNSDQLLSYVMQSTAK